WLTTWWGSFAETSWELLLLAALEGDRICGIAPMYIARECGMTGSATVRFLGHEHADYSAILIDRHRLDLVPVFIGELQRLARTRHIVELLEMPERAAIARAVLEMSASPRSCMDVIARTTCPRISFDGNPATVDHLLRRESLKRHTAK